MERDDSEGIVVRATVNLPGLRAGAYEVVDPTDPYVAGLLAATYLVPAEDEEEEPA